FYRFSFFILLLSSISVSVIAQDPPTLVPASVNGNSFTASSPVAFCLKSNQAKSDGSQNKAGSCSSTAQGSIPSFDRMVSSLIIQPNNAGTFDASKDTTVTVAFQNLQTGFFDDPQKQYYLFPQTLNSQGIIEGHLHVTMQQMSGKSVLDARVFAFFKGLNAASTDGKTLSVTVPAGTIRANGQFRICSLSGTFSHQPVIMPVAQRGAQDDCIRVNVINAGKVSPPATTVAAKPTTTTVPAGGKGKGKSATTTAAAAKATTAAGNGNGNGKGKTVNTGKNAAAGKTGNTGKNTGNFAKGKTGFFGRKSFGKRQQARRETVRNGNFEGPEFVETKFGRRLTKTEFEKKVAEVKKVIEK
ncbi:hypothetical protein HK096_005706, partial [Nowakowskiella sp. JEL0078]